MAIQDHTPLHHAALDLDVAAVRWLLEQGADANAAGHYGHRPLHCASNPRLPEAPDRQVECIDLLAAHGADLDAPNQGKVRPLHMAVRGRSPAAVRRLLELGARIDVRDKRGSTPLHRAVTNTGAGGTRGSQREGYQIAEVLLEHGADPLALNRESRSPRDAAQSQALKDLLTRYVG